MASPTPLTIFSLLTLLLISATHAISSDTPFIVAHKKITLTKLNSGSELVSVSIDICNRGSAAAYDVSLTDDSWSQEVFDTIIGNTSKSWERLDAVPKKAALQEAYSTPILPLDILADRISEKKFELICDLYIRPFRYLIRKYFLVQKFWAKYGSQISVVAIVALFTHLIASPTKSTAKGNKKKH
ncbi:unnamed protein product [Ilex paraguariensis]|uniref:Translocon-associated protein subunit beta n=1 Tax=Ilex paraguariensis TaxID=185542 RepID=A0ABC8U6R4_9AQUA